VNLPHSFSDFCGHKIHRIGIGTGRLASLGAGYSANDALRLLEAAAEIGVNLIDTADTYGSADCEKLLGKLIRRFNDHFLIATKTGYPFCDFPGPLGLLNQFGKKAISRMGAKPCFDADYVRKSIDGSLRRLRRERLDFFFLHDPASPVWEDDSLRSVIEQAKAAGKIHHFGISTSNRELHQIASEDPLIELLQMPLNPERTPPPDNPLPIVANHVFGAGSLLRGGTEFSKRIEAVARTYGKSASHILIAYAAAQPGVRCVLSGTGRAEHLKSNAEAVYLDLPDDVLNSLQITLPATS
jgi:aryl-alcohol dehydrogenase-like predicted oxidoreductase